MHQQLRFGIRQKTVVLVLVLSALQVAAVGWYLFNANKRVVVQHELVDLGDEAQLRAWEVVNRVEVLKADLRMVAMDVEVREALAKGEQPDAQLLSELLSSKCKEWPGYYSVAVSPIEAQREAETELPKPKQAHLADPDGVRQALVKELSDAEDSQVLLSKVVREQAEMVVPAQDGGERVVNPWLPVVWGAVRIDVGSNSGNAETAPQSFKLVFGLNLSSRSWDSDPRHLAFLIDPVDKRYLIHPDMGTADQFGDRDVFKWEATAVPMNSASAETVEMELPTNLVEEILFQQASGETAILTDENQSSVPPIRRIAKVEEVPLSKDFIRYFREGKMSEEFTERWEVFADWQREINAAAAGLENPPENLLNWRMRTLADMYAKPEQSPSPTGEGKVDPLRVSGISGTGPLRILGTSEAQVKALSDPLVRDLNRLMSLRVMPIDMRAVPHDTADFSSTSLPADLPEESKTVHWQSIITCDAADLICVRIEIADTAQKFAGEKGPSARGIKTYWFIYAAFRDELSASIEGELWPAIKRAGVGMVIAGVIAALLAMLSVRPLINMIEGARYLANSPARELHANIRKMTPQIPVDRKDEVGDIARAARKLFVTITANHRKLARHQKAIESHKDELEKEVARAVAELKVKNAELEAAADEKDKFLASVSHELRTPLTIVAGNLQLLLRKKTLGDRERAYANKSLAASKKLEALIRDLLDIQKIIMGGMSLEPAEFDVPELLAEIQDTLQPQAKKNNNQLTTTCDGIGTVFGDRVRLNQILTNLISNSCKFTQEGSVTIDAHSWTDEGKDWMKFIVTDTGRGMNEEEQKKVFTRFYTNKKANESGTGLGLDICRRLGELMGGHVYLQESAPGKGSVFVVELPQTMVVPGQSGGHVRAGEPKKKQRRRDFSAIDRKLKNYPVDADSPPTVLVIDDEPGIQDLMAQHLKGRGYEVLAADSGASGIEVARREMPDLITLDVMMDGSDGWEVLQSLKSDPVTEAIPVVMITIIDREEKGFALGADDYITKPVDWDHMFSVLGRLTSSGEKLSALVVDDDEGARQLFRSVLSKAGWEVAEACHGGEALERMREKQPSVVVLDLMMPEVDGFEFLEEFNKVPEWEDIPVIVVTAKEMSAAERKKLDESVARVIQKGTQTAGELLDEVQGQTGRGQQSSGSEPT